MYFHIDESGNTGLNLFDAHQPMLYYGVLGSLTNLDEIAEDVILEARHRLSVDRLHANEIGVSGIDRISDLLIKLHTISPHTFDIYFVKKHDHALICFFDQVFDQGLNPAITWSGYWSPLRYFLLIKVAYLFDEQTLKLAWECRIECNDIVAEEKLIQVCEILLERINFLPDQRSRELIGDALTWVIQNPEKIAYNCSTKEETLQISPNIIGFQSVMHGIAGRLINPEQAIKLIVDEQSQFNKAQNILHDLYKKRRHVSGMMGLGMPVMDLRNIPEQPLVFQSNKNSYGLEIVDIYLWIFKRCLERKPLSPNIYKLMQLHFTESLIDGVSLDSIEKRWSEWSCNLPEPTAEEYQKGLEFLAVQEKRREKPYSSKNIT